MPEELLLSIGDVLTTRFGLAVTIGKPLPIPINAFNPRRRQFHAPTILRKLHRLDTDEGKGVLGVTTVDLYVPGLTFVFGQAEISGKAALISLIRLNPQFYRQNPAPEHQRALYFSRAGKEAVHEIGHVRGLKHCEDPKCVMFFSNTIEDTDDKSDDFCSKHKKELKAG